MLTGSTLASLRFIPGETMKTHKVSSLGLLFSILTLLLAASLASAQTTEAATTTTGGNWTAAGTWTCSPTLSPCVPNNGTPTGDTYNVGINSGDVLLNSSSTPTAVTIDSLSVSGSLQIEALEPNTPGDTTLNVTDNLTGGELDIFDGTLNVGGNVSDADLNVYDGAVAIAGTLTNSSVDVAGGPFARTTSLTVGGPVPSTLGGYYVDFNSSVTFGSGEVTAISGGLFMEGGGHLGRLFRGKRVYPPDDDHWHAGIGRRGDQYRQKSDE